MAASGRMSRISYIGMLYPILLVVVGVSLPLSAFLSGASGPETLPLMAFQMVINGMAIVFLWYLYFYMRWFKHRYYRRKDQEEKAFKKFKAQQEHPQSQVVVHTGKDSEVKVDNGEGPGHASSMMSAHGGFHIVDPKGTDAVPFSYASEGVNFFLRLGAVGFGMGSIALECFQLSQFTSREVWDCLGTPYLINTVITLVFTFMQAHFVFKHHRVVIHFHQPFVRLCLLHMVAVNLTGWVTIVGLETTTSFLHHDTGAQTDLTHGLANQSLHDSHMTPSGDHVTPTEHHVARRASEIAHGEDIIEAEKVSLVGCLESSGSLASMASPYLFPCAIEFVLISAAVIFRVFNNVGRQIDIDTRRREALANSFVQAISGDCQKANSGLFLGLLVFTCSIVSLFFFLYIDANGGNDVALQSSILIYYITDHAVHSLAFIAICVAFYKISKLRFTRKLESSFDQNLVIIALFGHFLLSIFTLIASVKATMTGHFPTESSKAYTPLIISLSVLTLIQSAVQVVFIMDGLRRRSSELHHFRHKPGRSVITFLILCNMAMWMTSTFELRGIYRSPVHIEYYGSLAWNLIVHMFLPLSIFFRFHSAICLAEIWLVAYRVEAEHVQARQPQQPEVQYAGDEEIQTTNMEIQTTQM